MTCPERFGYVEEGMFAMRTRLAVILVLAVLFVVILAQNTENASVTLLFWTPTMSRIVLFAIIFGLGCITGILLGRPWRRKPAPTKTTAKAPSIDKE